MVILEEDLKEMQTQIKLWGFKPKLVCALASEDGNAVCGLQEGQWGAISVPDPEITTCPSCRHLVGFEPL